MKTLMHCQTHGWIDMEMGFTLVALLYIFTMTSIGIIQILVYLWADGGTAWEDFHTWSSLRWITSCKLTEVDNSKTQTIIGVFQFNLFTLYIVILLEDITMK